jgi:3'-phosphoadenosine 5'-phosphosulfate sulfotransferase (PAPS reductase)/FAD synthetase
MKTTLEIIDRAFHKHPKGCLAFSGGSDSLVLMDIIYRRTTHRPPVVFADDQMSHPQTLPFVRQTCERYGAALHIAKSDRTPLKQWARQGWPMLGKLAARLWMQKHKHRNMGFKLDVSSCCRNMKIAPARKLMRSLGFEMQMTGQRGQADDALRGLRTLKDSAMHYVKADRLFICNPLTGWTDTMIRRYIAQNTLQEHPAKAEGAVTIGCMFCGGGAQFTNSGFPILRRQCPDLWRWFIVESKAGEVILAIKYDVPLSQICNAVERIGGLERLTAERPHVFDFLAITPRQGYSK